MTTPELDSWNSHAATTGHRERLHRSPYLYTTDAAGNRTYNQDYQRGGFYYDPIYEGVSVDLDAEKAAKKEAE